jgi:Potato inhibitor I family
MEDHPTVSTEGGDRQGDHDGFEVNHCNKSPTKTGQPPAFSRRRRTYLAAAIVGLVLIVGIIVVLSLSLTGAFDKNGGSPPSSATSSSLSESESSGGGSSITGANNPNSSSGNDPSVPVTNTTSSTPIRNSTQTGGDGPASSSNSTTSGNNGSSTTGGAPSTTTTTAAGGAQYPTDPHEFLDIWSGDVANATAMTFDNGETVYIRWPECVGMVPDECETLVRSTNPYVNDVYVLGPFDYTTDEFRNDRVNVYTDENYAAVTQVPTIG